MSDNFVYIKLIKIKSVHLKVLVGFYMEYGN